MASSNADGEGKVAGARALQVCVYVKIYVEVDGCMDEVYVGGWVVLNSSTHPPYVCHPSLPNSQKHV